MLHLKRQSAPGSCHMVVASHSKYAEGTPTNFRVNFRNSQFVHGNVVSMTLVDSTITNMFHNVYESRRLFVFHNGVQDVEITMPIGRYSLDQWVTELQFQIVASGSAVGLTGYGVNPVTGQLTLFFDGNITYRAALSDSYRITGADSVTDVGPSVSVTFPGAVQFQGPQVGLMTVDITTPNAVFTLGSDDVTHGTLLDYVSFAGTPYGATNHQSIKTDTARMVHFSTPITVTDVAFHMRDNEGFELSLPANADVTLHLLLGLSDL